MNFSMVEETLNFNNIISEVVLTELAKSVKLEIGGCIVSICQIACF